MTRHENCDSAMEEILEQLKDYLVQDDIRASQELIETLILNYDWKEIVNLLKNATQSLYKQHLLKRHYMSLAIFNLSELLGVDCDLFKEIEAIPSPSSLRQASDLLFENLIQVAKNQLQSGGSTLFFSVDKLKRTRSVILIPDLVEARYRETIFILAEIDEQLPTLSTEWINAARLWRIGYGLRILKARGQGMLIHVNEYKKIRERIVEELGIRSDSIFEERSRLIQKEKHGYLHLSESLDIFIVSYITSLGIRGKFEPYYKSMIDHEGLDEF